MASNDEYEIALIDNEIDARLCAKLFAEEFALYNPLAAFIQITAKAFFTQETYSLMLDVLDEKLSFLIRHQPTNEVVAAIIANDLFSYYEKRRFETFNPISNYPTKYLFTEMLDKFVHVDFDQELKPNTVLFLLSDATRFTHAGNNLAAQLRAHICNHARNTRGFQYAFIQTCHPATRHIYVKKMNGKELRVVDPAEWVWKKKDDGLSRSFKDYKDEPVVNILINLNEQK
ncbi:unnamed protein product [Rotaria sordida]|uniref:Uncharacterized protein n=1 Tax=Rotaria sordida TaxID=392033 RepID=A0A814ZVW8_9BILA|nr:unnamed protein product [Rotaria sordida]CAF3877851.1 unnamed protein product [Rotaria sordida]